MDFVVRIVQPPGEDWRCLYEAAAGISYALNALGHDCILDLDRKVDLNSCRAIIFNAHRLAEGVKIPYDAIIFNAEQVQTEGELGAAWKASPYLKYLREHIVWDYSEVNIARLRQLGVTKTAHCPIGYWPGLSSIAPAQEDIDVLFVGSINDRRRKLLQTIASKGLSVHAQFGIYGKERDKWIARSKVILNAHFYPDPIWEVFRCSYLLANRKCVVTEDGGQDAALEHLARETCAYVPYDKITETCIARAQGNWKEAGEHGFNAFSKESQIVFVREALKAP